MMGANHGAFDQLQSMRDRAAFIQGIYDLLPEPRQRPTPELAVDASPLAELFRQIAPGKARARDPENPTENRVVVGRFVSVRGVDYQDEPLK